MTSSALAAAQTLSRSRCAQAPTTGSRSAMRARHACATAATVRRSAAISSRSSRAPIRLGSILLFIVFIQHLPDERPTTLLSQRALDTLMAMSDHETARSPLPSRSITSRTVSTRRGAGSRSGLCRTRLRKRLSMTSAARVRIREGDKAEISCLSPHQLYTGEASRSLPHTQSMISRKLAPWSALTAASRMYGCFSSASGESSRLGSCSVCP